MNKLLKRRKKDNTAEISILNLIDVIFMLLIFFMLATTFNNYTQFNLKLPKASTLSSESEKIRIEIVIDKDRNYFIKENGNLKKLKIEKIRDELNKIDKNLLENITLTADETLEYKTIVQTMEILKQNDIKNINLNIQK